MRSDEGRRLAYLDAMGVQVWQRREVGSRPVAESARTINDPHPGREGGSLSFEGMVHPNIPHPIGFAPLASLSPEGAGEEAASDDALNKIALDWEPLREQVLSCTRCGLHRQRTQAVFGVGNARAQWLVIGEGPGADEDRQGEPFVGRAGKLLNNMLLAIGLRREEVYIANIVKCRPPNNREPTPEEAEACAPYLARQIALIRPRIILAVGRIAAQNLLKTDRAVGALRGRRFEYADTGIPLVVTYHPAYLLRSPQEKRRAWQDLLFAKETFSSL